MKHTTPLVGLPFGFLKKSVLILDGRCAEKLLGFFDG
jgi:hypothetical protein